MKTIFINIEKQTVTIDGQKCNFEETGINDPENDLQDYFEDRFENKEIELIYE